MNEKSLENLQNDPERAREIGKLGGRPKGHSISYYISKILERDIEINDPLLQKLKKVKVSEYLAMKLLEKANAGDLNAIKEMLDRTEGKAMQFVSQMNYDPEQLKVLEQQAREQLGDELKKLKGDGESEFEVKED